MTDEVTLSDAVAALTELIFRVNRIEQHLAGMLDALPGEMCAPMTADYYRSGDPE